MYILGCAGTEEGSSVAGEDGQQARTCMGLLQDCPFSTPGPASTKWSEAVILGMLESPLSANDCQPKIHPRRRHNRAVSGR